MNLLQTILFRYPVLIICHLSLTHVARRQIIPAGLIHSPPVCGEKFAENCVVWLDGWPCAYLQGKMVGKCEVTHVSLGRGNAEPLFC